MQLNQARMTLSTTIVTLKPGFPSRWSLSYYCPLPNRSASIQLHDERMFIGLVAGRNIEGARGLAARDVDGYNIYMDIQYDIGCVRIDSGRIYMLMTNTCDSLMCYVGVYDCEHSSLVTMWQYEDQVFYRNKMAVDSNLLYLPERSNQIVGIYSTGDGRCIKRIDCPILSINQSSSALFCSQVDLLLVRCGRRIEAYNTTPEQRTCVWHTRLSGEGEMACDSRGLLYASAALDTKIIIKVLECKTGITVLLYS